MGKGRPSFSCHKPWIFPTKFPTNLATMLHAICYFCLLLVQVPSMLAATGMESSDDTYTVQCPPLQDINLIMAGLTASNILIEGWQKQYSSKYCSGFNISYHKDSWDSASARVCDSSLVHHAVDLAGMSGSFFLSQATTTDGWSFDCKRSKQQRITTAVRTVL